MTIRIVTDSACDLEKSEVDDNGIRVVPLSIRFGSDEFIDWVDLSVDGFYELLDEREELPETAAPAPGAFTETFRELAAEGADGICCINLSAGLSATMQSAQTAAEAVADEIEVRVIDSKSITAGLGSIVLAASSAARDGAGFEDIEALVADLSDRTRVFGVLDTLDNLRKGGRIGGAQALVGSLLSIKPIIDLSSGTVEEAGKQRTRKRALGWLRDHIIEAQPTDSLAIMHANAPDIDEFVASLSDHIDTTDVRIAKIGAVIGTHGGPGVMGAAWQEPS